MQRGRMGLALVAGLLVLLAFVPTRLLAQFQPPAQSINITAKDASTWSVEDQSVVQLDGPVMIEMDRTKLSAKAAVLWIADVSDGQPGEQSVSVALLGDAVAEQGDLKRSGDRLMVFGRVNGPIRITADTRQARDLHDSATYVAATALRKEVGPEPARVPIPPPSTATAPTTRPIATTRPTNTSPPILFHARQIESVTATGGKLAVALSGGVQITRTEENGQYLEMQADRAVLFTTLDRLRDISGLKQMDGIEDAITAAYLEGDVRVVLTPPTDTKGEQRLQANQVYYEFGTNRAILTKAVVRSYDPGINIPVIVRAETVRQLAEGEYRANKAELTTSGFAVPSFSVRADRAYVRQEETGDAGYGARTVFQGNDVTFNAFGVPFFYLPAVGASVTERGLAMRELAFGQSSRTGANVRTRWGFFETFGQVPPESLDLSYRIDGYEDRGLGLGLDGDYSGGFVSETTKKAWNFEGELRSYFLPNDTGVDDLGGQRGEVNPPNFRGWVRWEHQHFFPDDWQLQLRTAWISDATFMEEWFDREFDNGLPEETSLYLKRQRQTEAITFLITVQPNDFVTTADLLQEQFEVEKVPELGYQRIGDSLLDDQATFFSNNTIGRYRFKESDVSLEDQGFRFSRDVEPGRPSLGLVGVSGADGPPVVTDDFTDRVDTRQEIAFPFAAGQFKLMPYVFGRYTGYSDTPDGGRADRVFVGTGVRINTQFWKIDNDAESDLFDIHRVRHIVEPEVHMFTSASNIDPNELWIYETPVDNINDVSAIQLALRQRWQTKRGAPGRQRSVDFFTLNVEANLYANQPDEEDRAPDGFRGLFFASIPEASIPRNGLNCDATWRISDTTVALADMQYNFDEMVLATGSIGMVAQRGDRTSYYVGLRYIDELDSAIGTLAMSYKMTQKYSLGIRESFNFDDDGGVYSGISVQRRFDRFTCMLTVYNDSVDGESGVSFALFPEGLGGGLSSDAFAGELNR